MEPPDDSAERNDIMKLLIRLKILDSIISELNDALNEIDDIDI